MGTAAARPRPHQRQLRPVQRHNASHEAMEQIRSLIVNGTWGVGQRLPAERVISAELGISRPVVREAIRALEHLGYLEVRPGSGTYVRDFHRDVLTAPLRSWLQRYHADVMKVFEVRELMEPGAARLAAERATEAEINATARALDDMETALREERWLEFAEADSRFHRAVTEAAHNEILLVLADSIMEILEDARRASLRIPGQLRRAYVGHAEILEAIRQRDGDRAEAAMRRHLRDARYYIARELEQAGA